MVASGDPGASIAGWSSADGISLEEECIRRFLCGNGEGLRGPKSRRSEGSEDERQCLGGELDPFVGVAESGRIVECWLAVSLDTREAGRMGRGG